MKARFSIATYSLPIFAVFLCLSVGCRGEINFLTDGGEVVDPGEPVAADETPGVVGDPVEDTPTTDDETEGEEEACVPTPAFFERDLWPNTMQSGCAGCHAVGGNADGKTDFLFTSGVSLDEPEAALAMVSDYARREHPDHPGESLLLLKASGTIDHTGNSAAPLGSEHYARLEQFVQRLDQPDECTGAVGWPTVDDDLVLLDDRKLLRKATLSLAGRLPTQAEFDLVDDQGLDGYRQALQTIVDGDDGFYLRLQEGFNDIFLTEGTLLNVPHVTFRRTDYPNRTYWRDGGNRYYESDRTGQNRDGLYRGWARAAVALLANVVEKDRPITELVTADYTMVNPYSAKGLGVYQDYSDQLSSRERDRDYFIEAQLPSVDAGVNHSRFPHSGILTDYMFLYRWPSTPTNLNRARARVVYLYFLDTDIMKLAPRNLDAAVDESQGDPTQNNPNCTVCHKLLDPIASIYQNVDDRGQFRRADRTGDRYLGGDGWPSYMPDPGFEGETAPDGASAGAVQWLGQQIAADPRFASAMVKHVYYVMTRREPMSEPAEFGPTHPVWDLYRLEQDMLKGAAETLVSSNYNLKSVFLSIATSPLYRMSNVPADNLDDERREALAALKHARALTPEALERKVRAVFGRDWSIRGDSGLSDNYYYFLYGGIDSDQITQRLDHVSGVMAAVARYMANDLSCRNVAFDLDKPRDDRRLFPHVDVTDGPEATEAIDRNVQHLYSHLLGEDLAIDDPRVVRGRELFTTVVQDGLQGVADGTAGYSANLHGDCRSGSIDSDDDFVVRGWMAVVTYLLSHYEFIYE